jgi:Kdo2-lipid IVA lauroyltransferase/acyltransferase
VKRRSRIRNLSELATVRFVFGLLRLLPEALSAQLANGITQSLRLLVPRLTQVADRNLQLALPDLSASERRELTRGVFRSLGRLLWVMARTSGGRRDRIERFLQIENLHIVQEAFAQGKGILFATGHVGAWELSALSFGAMVQPMDVIARPLDNPLLEQWVQGLRTRTGNRILAKAGTLRDVLRALADNRAVGFLVDHNVISADLAFIGFFGLDTAASTVFAKLAARSNAVVVPGFALWEEGQRRYVLRFYPPVPITGDPVADTQRIHAQLEEVIRAYPDQWLWIHRRFKTRPEGQPDLYSNLSEPVGTKEGTRH